MTEYEKHRENQFVMHFLVNEPVNEMILNEKKKYKKMLFTIKHTV